MKKIFETADGLYLFDDQKEIMIIRSKNSDKERSSEEMAKVIKKNVELIEQYAPTYFIYNQKENKYVFKVEEQKATETIFTKAFIKVGLKKLAFIHPTDLLSELSLDQTIQEAGKTPHAIKYFSTEEEAINWFEE